MKPLRIAFLFVLLARITYVSAETADSVQSPHTLNEYLPHVHGVIRTRFEASTVESAYRFQVRNARLSVAGGVGPIVSYFMQADLCDRGKMKMLDAWIGVKPYTGLDVRVGQFRVPFGIDAFRSPFNYIFSNRSFLVKDCANYRAVGGRVAYVPVGTPLTLEAGVFNPGSIGDHQPWHSSMSFASKATLRKDGVTASVSYLSHRPQSRRINFFDAALGWTHGGVGINAEYLMSHPVGMGADGVAHAYLAEGNYRMGLKGKFFNRLSFQARFDGTTRTPEFSNNTEEAQPTGYQESRRRITLGSTISHIRTESLQLHLRVDYEKYFYNRGIRPDADNGDKAVVELVLTF